MNVQKTISTSESPRLLDNNDLIRCIPYERRKVAQLHRECSVFLGRPCPEGQRRYAKYRVAQASLKALEAEARHRKLKVR